jgi:hypothetical protein
MTAGASFEAQVQGSSHRNERIGDAQAFLDHHPILHVFRPQRVAAGVKRRGDDHGVIGSNAVAPGQTKPGFVDLRRHGMHLQQGANHRQERMGVGP